MTWLIALACIAGLTIEAPKSSPRDKLVRCMAKVDAGREVVTYLWDVESRGADVDVDRETAAERLWWVASPGRYRVEVIVGYAGGGIERARADVVIEGGTPGPGPGPDPGPTPTPRPTGFAGDVYDQAIKVARPADCKRMAANFASVGSAVAAGGMTAQRAVEELTARNLALGLDQALWSPFARWLAIELDQRVTDHASAAKTLQAVADGLQAAGAMP